MKRVLLVVSWAVVGLLICGNAFADVPMDGCTEVPRTPTVIDGNTMSETAPVISSDNTVTLDFPAYCDPVDIYMAFYTSTDKLYFFADGDFTESFDAYAVGATSENSPSFSISEFTGESVLYWLVAPTNGGDLIQTLNAQIYELGYYVFDAGDGEIVGDQEEVNCEDALPTITSTTPNSIQPATLLTVKGTYFKCLDIENHTLVIDGNPSNILNIDRANNSFQIVVPMLEPGSYDLYIDFTQDQKSNAITIDIEPLSLPIDMSSDEILAPCVRIDVASTQN